MDIEWIREGLKRPGKSQAGLARALGLNPSAVNRILKGERRLRADELPRIEAYLGQFAERRAPEMQPPSGLESPARPYRAMPPSATPDQIPVLGAGEAGADGQFEINGEIVDYVARPASLAGSRQAYAIYVAGTSMEPRYHPGELVYVHPGKPVTPGCYVVVQTQAPGETPRAFIKRFVKRLHDKIQLEQLNPRKIIGLSSKSLLSLHRIVGSAER